MSTADRAQTPTAPHRLPSRLLHPPVRDARFWIVQAGVITLAILHDVVLVALHTHDLAGVPAPTTSGLLLIPVLYAAVNFGVRGAVGTALWATILIIPHWLFVDEFTATHVWIEVGYLLVLNVVAVVVGQRVEHEQRARHRAEDALRAARDAEARYYTLFEDQPAAVLITDTTGMVVEVNTAATRLLGKPARGHHLTRLLGIGIDALLDGQHSPLTLDDPGDNTVLLTPTAHRVTTADGRVLVQVVLSDITEQHRRQEEQRLFAGRLLTVQEEERRRLARELHDDPLQNLTYLTRTLDDLSQRPCSADQLGERLSHGAAVAEAAATALRKVIQGLRPPVLDDLGVVSALRQLTEDNRTAATVTFKVTGTAVRLDPDLELAVYRIAQEALTNVARHAQANRVTVRLAFTDAQVSLTITDDGGGIGSADTDGGPAVRLGLIGMRERVNMAGGTLEVSPRRPHGTRVHVTLPLPPNEKHADSGPITSKQRQPRVSSTSRSSAP